VIGLNASPIEPVVVETSQNGGLSAEQITELCCRKIVYVSAGAPPVIQQQAEEFRERIAVVVHHYVKEAMRSERDRLAQIASKGGYEELTNLLRRA
jgi:7-keto-8-aminopelargonate synthetase-like enzyme